MVIDVSDFAVAFSDYSERAKERGWVIQHGLNGLPNPKARFDWCWLAEEFAKNLVNSDKINHNWKKDFICDNTTEKWDLKNTEGVTIEVKSTASENEFTRTSVRLNLPEQAESMIMKLSIGEEGFTRLKFVRKLEGKWFDLTSEFE
jgi:hypothetical protein